MNEQTKKLVLQAGFTNAYADPQDGFELVFVDEEHTTESVAKLVELIVKECADICTARKLTPAEFVASELREYFGVER